MTVSIKIRRHIDSADQICIGRPLHIDAARGSPGGPAYPGYYGSMARTSLALQPTHFGEGFCVFSRFFATMVLLIWR